MAKAMEEKLRILILEDRPNDADLVEFALEEAGLAFIARRTDNREEFIRELDEFYPDLILSDYDLPQYNGMLALTESKKRLPGVPFILVTGALDEGDDRIGRIMGGGASACLSKNSLDQLGSLVHQALWSQN